MKLVKYVCCTICFVLVLSPIPAQKLTTGIMTGPNFSNIWSENPSGKWESKTGSSSAVWLNYALGSVFSIGTEVNYTSLLYQYKDYQQSYNWGVYDTRSVYMPYEQAWNFNYLRFPLYMKLSTPTKLRFDFLAGMYYATHLQGKKEDRYPSETYPGEEVGGLFGIGLSYPVTDKFEFFIQGRFLFSGKKYNLYNEEKKGNYELMLGIGYSLFNKMTVKTPSLSEFDDDNDSDRFSMKYRAGFNASWIKTNIRPQSYTYSFGFSSGVAANYLLGENVSFQFELLFENKGYQMADSSSTYYKYDHSNTYSYAYYADTKTRLSYLTVPLLLQFSAVEGSLTYFANTGFYYSGRLKARTIGSAINENRYEGTYQKTLIDVCDDIDGVIKPHDFGWIIGGGIQFQLKNKWKIDIEGRYQQGWTNILESEHSSKDQSMKNNTVSILFGLQIPIH